MESSSPGVAGEGGGTDGAAMTGTLGRMATTNLSDDVGRVLGGRYRIVAPIGSGASARVFVADDVTLRRRVAVKVLHEALADDDAFLRRFRAEAQAAASLNHPHVLGVYDWGHDEVPYLVSEYLSGGSLRTMLDARGILSPSQALLVGLEAARGLEYAHGEGLVHRDIKPANLLFGDSARLRIADFGLARALAEAGWTDQDGSMVGTARYAAPEQARGERVGPPADVFALALAINECVSGDVPYTMDTPVATLMARADTPLEPDPRLGPLAAAVRRAGVVDPDERPSAGELAAELMAAAGDLPRPEPLPLAGPVALDQAVADDVDATIHGAVPVAAARRGAVVEPDDDVDTGRRWPWMVAAILTILAIAAGAGALWWFTQPVTHDVPPLVGLTEADAVEVAADNGWELEVVDIREPDTVAGEIVRTDPEEGTALEEGETLTIHVSLGEPLVSVPVIAGLTIEEAAATLEADGLTMGRQSRVPDEDVAVDLVIGPDLAAGESQLEPGSAVDVFVSDGPTDRTVPDVPPSRDPAVASEALVEARLVPVEASAPSGDVPEGQVIGFEPGTGTVLPADSEVQVVVSEGPPPVEVPNVVGLDVSEATAEIESVGLVVSGVDGSPTGPVLTTDPGPGTVLEQGSSVAIITSGGR